MEENKKNKQKFIIFIIIAFLIGFTLGKIYLPLEEKEISFVDLIKKIEFQDKSIDDNLFLDILETIRNKYFKQVVSEKNLFYGALKGLVSGLNDPYSIFLDPEFAQEFKVELSGTFEGIGAEIDTKKGRIIIVAPLENTPAYRVGLKAGDEIYTIDGINTLGMSLDEAVSKIRGKKGTQVKLLILREGWEKPKEFVITRDVIKIKTVRSEIKKDDIAYLKISYFNDKTISEFERATREILTHNPKGLILDLRNNPGGYLYATIEIAGLWLGDKVVVIEKSRQEEREHRSNRKEKIFNLPTVVLINKGSASGSEILAGALQDYGLAKILGEKTFGKGSIQELIEFKDGSMIKITVAQWLTPKKREIEEKGIEPDIKLEITEEDYKEGKDPLLEKAIEVIKSEIQNPKP